MPLKILHVASFIGNIGDNASHMGLYHVLNDFLYDNYCVHQIEIRKFYNNYKGNDKHRFDRSFIEFANNFDLLVIGGGGFLDYWVPNSATGTTINVRIEELDNLKTPMLITSVGCFPHKPVPDGNLDRLKRFLDYSLHNRNITITFRNDGSLVNLAKNFGENYSNKFIEILDNGFFYIPKNNSIFPVNKKYIAINISNDQIDMLSNLHGRIDKKLYYEQIKVFIETIIHEHSVGVVLLPHIHSDLKAISMIVERLDDLLVRSNVSIAPCVQSDAGADYSFSIYNNSSLVIGTRFHANVCAVAMGKKCIGIAVLDRVKFLYDSLNAKNSFVFPDKDFDIQLTQKAKFLLKNDVDFNRNHLEMLKNKSTEFYRKYLSKFT